MSQGFTGSVVFTSTVTSSIVAIGKKYVGGQILSTAFNTVFEGNDTVALPYVRWAEEVDYEDETGEYQRTYIAIQNLDDTSTGSITVAYCDIDGSTQCTHTIQSIAAYAKVNSISGEDCPGLTEFGYANGRFGGSAIITGPGDSQLQVMATVESLTGSGLVRVAEDYNGLPVADQ